MRKIVEHIIGIIVVILAAAGCMSETMTTKIPVNIGFRPVIGHDTRADESIPFPQDRTFSAWAVSNFDQSIYINNETIACNGGEWKSKCVWPEESLRFSAFYPQDVPHTFSYEKGVMINEYSTADGGRDLLIASTVAGGDESTDSLVNLRFDHILSRIEFRMQHSLSSDITVMLQKVELTGFALQGSYNVTDYLKWNKSSENETYVVFEDEDGIRLSTQTQYIGNDFYTIPQLCKAEIIIRYKIRYGNNGWVTDQIESTGNLRSEWGPGKQYTYTLNLTETKLTCTTGISNWNNREE